MSLRTASCRHFLSTPDLPLRRGSLPRRPPEWFQLRRRLDPTRRGECGVYPDLLQLPPVGRLLLLQAFAQLGADLEETGQTEPDYSSDAGQNTTPALRGRSGTGAAPPCCRFPSRIFRTGVKFGSVAKYVAF